MSNQSLQMLISVDAIAPSPTNPRKDFPEDGLVALAENITIHGVISPVLVRFTTASPGELDAPQYELVCGERRWRAARMAALKLIPAIARDLSDEQVIEIQLVENLQREDLSPIEEAEGYERLQKECGLTADQIAEKIGQSRSYVFGRLKLLDLGEVARKALRDKKLTASTALLIARIPIKAMQEQATREITENNWLKDVLSYREAARHVQQKYMLRLSTARFDTRCETLIATAGSCHKCPNRTGNQPALFDDVDSADVCTNPECFQAKNVAAAEAKTAAAEAAERKEREERERQARDAAEEAEFQQRIEDENREAYFDAINAGKAGQAQPPATATIEQHVKAKGGDTKVSTDSAKKLALEVEARRQSYVTRLFDRCRSHLIQNPPDVPESLRPLLALVAIEVYGEWGDDDIAGLWIGPKPPEHDYQANRAVTNEFRLKIPSMSGADVVRLLCDLAVSNEAFRPWAQKTEGLEAFAALCGIDKEALLVEIAAEEKAKREAEEAEAAVEAAAKGKKAAPKQSKKPATAADKTASHPRKAPRGGEVVAAEATKPAAKAKVAKSKPGKSKDQAPAKPADKPTPSAGTKTPAPKYRNPANPEQTWSGRGKQPAWVVEALSGPFVLADLEAKSDQAPARPAEGGNTTTVSPLSPVAAWPFPASAAA